uniref:Transglutaminase-like domain-containing protein n=1 Tax=candidate division WOR-3 bacterium TaxID=2052148 RepID=A0A7V3NTZ4_UNCW3
MKEGHNSFLPKNEEVENPEVRSLAKRLKGRNDAETLTNILEWEDRNLKFWDDRWLIPLMLLVPLVGLVVAEIILLLEKMFVYYILVGFCIGTCFSIILYLKMKYNNIKRTIPEFVVNDIFMSSLPMEKILRYRLSICRDYAKLTMSLLLNLYPNGKLYFVEIPGHVAAAVKLDETIYVLDQHLPILSLKKWIQVWKNKLGKRKLEPQLLMVKKNDGIKIIKTEKFRDDRSQYEANSTLSKMILTEITNKLKREFLVKKMSVKNFEEFQLPVVKKFRMFLEEDEVIKYSLQKHVKMKIEDELCNRIQDMVDLDLQENNNDLILKVKLKGEESE